MEHALYTQGTVQSSGGKQRRRTEQGPYPQRTYELAVETKAEQLTRMQDGMNRALSEACAS